MAPRSVGRRRGSIPGRGREGVHELNASLAGQNAVAGLDAPSGFDDSAHESGSGTMGRFDTGSVERVLYGMTQADKERMFSSK
jgi:hypothetical protein